MIHKKFFFAPPPRISPNDILPMAPLEFQPWPTDEQVSKKKKEMKNWLVTFHR